MYEDQNTGEKPQVFTCFARLLFHWWNVKLAKRDVPKKNSVAPILFWVVYIFAQAVPVASTDSH